MTDKKPSSESLGLYIHIPFCEAKCRYCSFYSEPIKNHNPRRLISAIITEFPKRCQPALSEVEGEPFYQTVYIGGGSPSCLPKEQLLRLVNFLPKVKEFTVEVNPKQVSAALLSQLRTAGVNRLSIGAQSFDNTELRTLGRRHSGEDIFQAVESAKQAGFDNIGLDLIFAIPGSTITSWKRNLLSAIDLGVQHISAYALTYEEGTPLQKTVEAGQIKPVDEETDRLMYETAIDEFEKTGFLQYEISNFARPGFECRHNLNYWANLPYIGIGPAAGSFWNGCRTTNIADINKYIEAIEKGGNVIAESETLTPLQAACETAVLNLRRRCGIILDEFKKQTGYQAIELFAEPIEKYRKYGFIEASDDRIFLTQQALPIADSILCDFSDV